MVKDRVLPLTLVSRSNSILGKNEDVSKELDFAGLSLRYQLGWTVEETSDN